MKVLPTLYLKLRNLRINIVDSYIDGSFEYVLFVNETDYYRVSYSCDSKIYYIFKNEKIYCGSFSTFKELEEKIKIISDKYIKKYKYHLEKFYIVGDDAYSLNEGVFDNMYFDSEEEAEEYASQNTYRLGCGKIFEVVRTLEKISECE